MSLKLFQTYRQPLLRKFFQSSPLCQLSMYNVSVRCVPESDKMQISVLYKGRTYNMERLKDEEIGKCLSRLQANLMKVIDKKNRKKKKQAEQAEVDESISLHILKKGKCVADTLKNIEAWTENSELAIGEDNFKMEINPPTVKSVSLPASIMAGFPLFPKHELEFADYDQSQFIWHREPKTSSTSSDEEAIELHRGKYFSPSVNEIGHRLKLTVIPVNGERCGKESSVVSKFEVEAGPGLCPFEKRQLYTKKEAEEECLRVISYNILADLYADSDFSRTQLYPYCPPYALSYDYRKQLLLKEISGYNGDVICLQEVDRRAFESDFSPALNLLGFDGIMMEKGGQVSEGSAMFYRRSKLKLLGQHDIVLSTEAASNGRYSDLWSQICSLSALKEKMEARTTILQLAVFEPLEVKDKILCIANTHLYFHPKASHVRLLQTAISMRHLESVMSQYKSQKKTFSFVFCGDFNSVSSEEVNTFMTTKFIPADYLLWSSGGEEEKLTDLELHHDFNIISACGYTPYTNFTVGFHGMLDYIFIDSDNLSVTQVIPMPDHEDITAHVALPSIVSPSDHIAQICDIKWK